MVNKPTKEQIKEFWEWCGLTFTKDKDGTLRWYDTKGDFVDFGYPDTNLNSLFEYAWDLAVEKIATDEKVDTYSAKWSLIIRWMALWDIIKDPVPALFWAMYKVIKEAKQCMRK